MFADCAKGQRLTGGRCLVTAAAYPAARLSLRSALPATLSFIHFGDPGNAKRKQRSSCGFPVKVMVYSRQRYGLSHRFPRSLEPEVRNRLATSGNALSDGDFCSSMNRYRKTRFPHVIRSISRRIAASYFGPAGGPVSGHLSIDPHSRRQV